MYAFVLPGCARSDCSVSTGGLVFVGIIAATVVLGIAALAWRNRP